MKCGNPRIGRLLLTFILVAGPAGFGRAAGIGWPEAVSRLAEQRSKAETCVGVLKGLGDKAQIARGRLDYAPVKGNFDALIAGLITALSEGGSPQSLPSLETELQHGTSGLKEFCKTAAALIPNGSGQKGILDAIVKAAIEPVINALSDAVAALYRDHRKDAALTRQTIQTQLEAAKWPDFGAVQALRQ
jgi:hypothetical protein